MCIYQVYGGSRTNIDIAQIMSSNHDRLTKRLMWGSPFPTLALCNTLLLHFVG